MCYNSSMKETRQALLITTTLAILVLGGIYVVPSVVRHFTAPTVAQVQTVEESNPEPIVPVSADGMLRLINIERTRVGVAPLVINDKLMRSAQFKADDMRNRGYFGHTAPGSDRNNGLDYLDSIDEGLCKSLSENITDNVWEARNTSDQAVFNWMFSPPHYKAMIDPRYSLTGFGISGTKIVQHFCIAN